MPFIKYILLPHRNIAIPLIVTLLLLTINITVYRYYIKSLYRRANLVTVIYSIIISICLLYDLVAINSITYYIVYGITSPYYYCCYPWDKGLSFLRGGTITIASYIYCITYIYP